MSKPPKDDLTEINGITMKIERLLNEEEIYQYTDLAEAPKTILKKIWNISGDKRRNISFIKWINDARLAAIRKWASNNRPKE